MNTVQSLLILLATLMMGNSSSSTVYESSEVAASVSASASASASALAQEESNDIKSQLSYIEEQSKRLLGETSTPAPNRPRNPPPSDTSSSGGGSSSGGSSSSSGGGSSGGGSSSSSGGGSSGGGSSSSSGGSGGGSGSGGGGGGGANGVQSGDLVSVKSSKNLALMLSIAAVAGVAIAAYAVPRRTVTTKSDHPLRGSLNRRINLFSNLAQHADSATRPPRRDEEGHYINADAIV